MTEKFCLVISVLFLCCTCNGDSLVAGQKYKITKPMFLIGEYKSRKNKTVSKETAIAYLEASDRAKMSYTAFEVQVAADSIMTILGPAEKPWYLYFHADQYFVKLEPDLSQGLDTMIFLDRGLDGDLDGLNPDLFTKM